VLATRYLAEISTPRAADKSAQAQSQLARVMRSSPPQPPYSKIDKPGRAGGRSRVLDLAG
jgi:hypothetical protein